MERGEESKARPAWREWGRLGWFPLYTLWLELVCRVGLFGKFLGRGLGYTALFALAIGFALCALTAVGPGLYRRAATGVFSVLLGVWFSAQIIYHTIFSTLLTLFSVGNGGAALQFWREALRAMGRRWYLLALVWAPALGFFLWTRRKPRPRADRRLALGLAWVAVALQLLGWSMVTTDTSGGMSPSFLYQYSFIPEQTAEEFGILTTLRLDARQLLWGVEEQPQAEVPTLPPMPTAVSTPAPVVYAPNVMDIDFAALAESAKSDTLKAMHQWFGSREPTMQNKYTGAWKGKNLIFIVAEGFTTYAMTPETTPTLWKLSQEGFVCEEYYNPLWWVSTSDGEYVADTSLIPKSGEWSFYHSSKNLMRFCLGNQLAARGYATRAYHDHTYTYYKRHLSHPNMGYDYKGLGKGLDVKEVWPESDVEMMEKTLPEYIGDAPFHTYYMTVSGHMNYSFMGNTQSYRHRDEVGHEDMSEEARAYLACQMELDQAVAYLIDQLRGAGELENTAIVLSGDHYPYSMEKKTIHELAGHEVEENFETYRSTLILWSGDREGKPPIRITKPVCSLDILPTVSNLMGLEYDSRLLMGHDALSTYPGLAVLSNRSFVTDLGRYNSRRDAFEPREGKEVPEGYVQAKCREVEQMFTNSTRVLERDYYRALFGS